MPYFIVLLFTLLMSATIHAQNTGALSDGIKTIASNGNTFEQKLESMNSENSAELMLEVNTIDKKGKEEIERFEFNLIDLDARLLRREVKNKTMYLTAKTDDGQKMIKYFKEEEQENYRNYFSIAVEDADDYRILEELFETAIKEAKKGESQDLSNQSLAELLGFLKENVKTVKINDGAYAQEIGYSDPAYVLDLKIEDGTSKNGKSERYQFSLADLQEQSIKISVSGKKLLVKVGAQNGKRWIEKFVDGEFSSFVSSLEFVVNSTTEARNIASVLKHLIPEARKLEKDCLTALAPTEADRLRLITGYVKNITTPKKELQQELTGDCVWSYTLKTLEGSDKSTVSEYAFNLIDFEKKKTEIKASSSGLSVTIKGESSLVKYLKEGEPQSYKNTVSFWVDKIGDAKALAFLLEQQIASCQEKGEEAPLVGGTAESLLANCAAFISDIDVSSYTYKQKLEAVDQVPCKLQFTQIKSDKNKDTEVLYEFNLSDMNPRSVDFAVSGKELSIRLYTKNKEKVIKRYLGDEKSDYVDHVKMYMNEVEQTRKLIVLFKALVKACEE